MSGKGGEPGVRGQEGEKGFLCVDGGEGFLPSIKRESRKKWKEKGVVSTSRRGGEKVRTLIRWKKKKSLLF